MKKKIKTQRLPANTLVKINKKLAKSTSRAEALAKDKKKAKKVLDEAIAKAEEVKGPIAKVWDSLMLMFGLIRDWITGQYKRVPIGSIIAILAGIIYFLSPIDAIPDFIPVIGYIDDVWVLGIVIAQVGTDLERYETWRDAHA